MPAVRYLIALLLLIAVAAPLASPAAAQDYYSDIRPVVVDNCVRCHTEGGVGFSMDDAEAAYARRRAVGRAILSRHMPPWLAEVGHQEYVDDATLSPEQLAMVSDWVDAGHPKGDARADTEPAVVHTRFAADLTLDILPGASYLPPQDREDDYRCFVVDWTAQEPSYVTGFRTRPGNRSVAHHVVVYAANPDMADRFRELRTEEDGAGYQCFGGAEPDRLFDDGARAAYEARYPDGLRELARSNFWLAHWAPGMDGYAFPEGTGVRLAPGSVLIVQMHYYSAHAPGESDAGSVLEFTTANEVERRAFHYPLTRGDWLGAKRNGTMVIPAGSMATYQVSDGLDDVAGYASFVTGVPAEDIEALEVHSANLHMHKYGHSGVITLTDSDGRQETLLSVPRWDLAWQRDFTFVEPKVFARDQLEDTRLAVSCTYENPEAEPVYGGYGSDEEMCFNFSYIAVRTSKDVKASAKPQPNH